MTLFPSLDTEVLDPEIESDVLTIPEPADPSKGGSGYRVILYNDDHTPMDAVVEQLIKATQCGLAEAVKIMTEAHYKGRAVCYKGSREKCQRVARILREIRLQCEVDCD